MLLTLLSFFLFTAPPTTAIYTLSLHDALPISLLRRALADADADRGVRVLDRLGHRLLASRAQDRQGGGDPAEDRKSTRLNSSHVSISYAVFCLKKKK